MINAVNHIINIDLANKINVLNNFQIKQNDTDSHIFTVNIFNNSLAYDLTGLSAKAYFKKQDNTKVFQGCIINGSSVTCVLSTQTLTVPGVVQAEITIYGAGREILTSSTFNFIVIERLRDDSAIESTNEFTALTEGITKLNQWDAQFKSKYDGLNAEYAQQLTQNTTSIKNVNTEITNARKGETSLKAKIDNIDASLAANANQNMYRQALINGNFDIWQRGVSFTDSKAYTADRWLCYRTSLAAGLNVTRQTIPDLVGSMYCIRLQRASGNIGTTSLTLGYNMETIQAVLLAGNKVTVSFNVRKGINYSGGNLRVVLVTGTGVDQSILNSYTGAVNAIDDATISPSSSWQRYTITTSAILPANVTELGFYISYTPVGTAGTNDYIEFAQIQLNAGSSAVPFQPKSFNDELLACMRYYEKSYPYANFAASGVSEGEWLSCITAATSGAAITHVPFKVLKRVNPTVTLYAANGTLGAWYLEKAGWTGYASTGTTSISNQGFSIQTNSATTAFSGCLISGHWVADAEL